MAAMGSKAFGQILYIKIGAFADSHSHFCDLIWSLQYILTWNCSSKPLEAVAGSECSNAGNYGYTSRCQYNNANAQAALVINGFWLQFKVLVIIYKTLQGSEPGYPIISVHLIRTDRIAMLQVLSIKQCYVMELLSVAMLSETQMTETLLAFRKRLKMLFP